MRNYSENWFPLPDTLNNMSATEAGQRTLDKIAEFRRQQTLYRISDRGFTMTDIGGLPLEQVHGIEFVPLVNDPTDCRIVVFTRQYFSDI